MDKMMACSANVTSGSSKFPKKWIKDLVWRNIIFISCIHIAAIGGIYQLFASKVQWQTVIFTTIYGISAGIGITAGAHRLWSHRCYKAKLPLRILLIILNSMAVQTNVYEWCRDHRVHHKFSETEADPHNAKRGFFFSHVGWLFLCKHPQVKEKGASVDLSDLLADPVVKFQKRYHIPLVTFFGFVLPILIPVILWKETILISYLACMTRYAILLNSTWLVNSAAHLYGYRPYNKKINPRENWLVSFFAMGEGFHNFHHTFPWDYSTGELGWFLNISTIFIDVMAKLGLAYDLKKAPQKLITKTKLSNTD